MPRRGVRAHAAFKDARVLSVDRLGNHGNFALILLLIFRRKECVILLSNAAADEQIPPDSVSNLSAKK